MADKRACRSRRTGAQPSRASCGTKRDRSNRQTRSELSTLAGKTEVTIRLEIRSSDRIFRRQRARITPCKWVRPDEGSEKIAKAREFCEMGCFLFQLPSSYWVRFQSHSC